MAWTKIQTAVVVGAVVVLAAGTTTVVVEKTLHPKLSPTDLSWLDDPKYWALDSSVLNKLPSVFVLRPTKFSNTSGSVSTGQRALCVNASMENLLANAYSCDPVRMVLKTDLPAGKFDCVMTPPYKPWTALQGELKKQFGLTAHTEMREMDVLQLKSTDGQHPGLKAAVAGGNSGMSTGPGKVKVDNQSMSTLSTYLQGHFGMPITDHTGLSGRYDLSLKWAWNYGKTDSAEREKIKQALLNQLGLELVPSREKIEMLVVEKAN